MARQKADGSWGGSEKKGDLTGLFENPVTGLVGTWNWEQCDTVLLAKSFTAINRRGDLMSLCTNASNTAGAVTVISGGDKHRRWFNSYDEADAWFEKASQAH